MPSPFDDIFGTKGPQWTREQIIARIRGEAAAQKIDPDLALAVATQESSLQPDNHGDNGKSRGLFHLQEKAAIDAGINPKWRDDPGVNIYGGVRYLKQKLDQSKGNVEQALSRYNRGTPDYQGIGDPNYVNHVLRHYNPSGALAKQQPTLLQRAAAFVQPASAEAATPPAPGRSRLDEIEAELHRRDTQQPSTQVPARSRLDEVEAELARRDAQQAPPSTPAASWQEDIFGRTPPQGTASAPERGPGQAVWDDIFGPQPAPTATPPSTTGTPPPSPGAAEAPRAPDTTWTPGMRFQALPSIQQLEPADRAQKTKLFESLDPASQAEFLRSEEPASDLTIDIAKPSTPQPGAGPPPRTDAERLTRVHEELAAWERQAGRPWREGDPRMPSEKRLGLPDEAPLEEGFTKPSTLIPLIMGVGIPGLTTAAPGMAAAERLVGKAGPLITRGARAVGEGLSQTLGWGTGRTIETGQVPSPGEIGTEAAWNVGTGGAIEGLGAARRGMIRRSRGGQAVQQEGQAVVPEAYQQAVEGQRSAIQTARAVPGRYTPETPSWVMYERFGDAAKDAVVDLAPAKTALAEVRASRGVLPDGTVRPFPSQVETLAAHLEKATGETSIKTIREELRRLAPLTRHADGNIRGPAKQLYGIYADVLEASPVANELLRNANATFRKEMALQDVQEWLRPGHGVIRIDNQGREVINVGSLLTRLEKKIGDDTLFARSFGPEELQRLRQDFGAVAGTPTMPRGAPPAPQTAREAIGERPRFLPGKGTASELGGLEFLATSLGVPLGVVSTVKAGSAVSQQMRYGLAYALTSARLRPLVLRAIHENGTINPRVYGLIIAAMSPAEKKALERATRGKR